MAGLSKGITGDQVQITLGTIARDLHVAMKRSQDGVDFLALHNDQELLADFGITAGDAAQLRAAYDALDALWRIYRGADALPVARNFRSDVRKIAGLGF
jgi:hypothetical protein